MSARTNALRAGLMAAGVAVVVGVAGACSVADPDIGIVAPPSDATNWEPVANFMDLRCGTLDCHGNPQRNLVIWGCDGLRDDTGDAGLSPSCRSVGGQNTTPREYNDTYRSLVGLEPSVMSYVVAHGGDDPELLTFIRKARGEESHKGNQLIVPGDVQDQCVCSWLTGTTNQVACTAAFKYATAVGVAPAQSSGADAGSENGGSGDGGNGDGGT